MFKNKISLNRFRQMTKGKRVGFTFWNGKEGEGEVIKEFVTDKFYCNPCPKTFGGGAMLSMPNFMIGKEAVFYEFSPIKFEAVTEFGITTFFVIHTEGVI